MNKRIHVLIPSVAVAILNIIFITAFSVDFKPALFITSDLAKTELFSFGRLFPVSSFTNILWAFAGGMTSGPLALLLLPLIELNWRTASTFKLNRYLDLQLPLMRELLIKAPGTYQHTMTVAYLSQAAGEAIGANTLLLRISAYYHDIGKVIEPKFFIENQFNGKNFHDELRPVESAQLIINHVRDGKKVAQEAGIPEVVIDMILQHHGTQLMEYFYNKAEKATPEESVNGELYRYPGPKPQSIEAAILLITDAVEAASRSIQKPSRKKIEKLIRFIIHKRIADGQFDECDLSTCHIAKISQVLIDSLEATFHSRVTYPWQEKEKKKVA